MKLTTFFWVFSLLLTTSSCKKENIKPDLNFTAESYGCSSFIVYKVNKDEDAAVAVIGNRDNLNLTTSEKSFNLYSVNANDLKVEIKRFKGNSKKFYCNDVPSEAGDIISTWTGKNGTVKIIITQDSIATNPLGKPEYKITVKLENMDFENENGKRMTIDNLEFKEVYVGWLPG